MNHEKINAVAEEYALKCGYPKSDKEIIETTYWTMHNRSADGFVSGVNYAADNPDVIDCIKLEDALGFAEWVVKNYYHYVTGTKELFITKEWDKDKPDFPTYTTEELYQEYLKQKQ